MENCSVGTIRALDNANITHMRTRSFSFSGRIRCASIMCENGDISSQQRDVIKEMIMCGDLKVEKAIQSYEDGNREPLLDILKNGNLHAKPSNYSIFDSALNFENLDFFHNSEIELDRRDLRIDSVSSYYADDHKWTFRRKPAPSIDQIGYGYTKSYLSDFSVESVVAGHNELSPVFGNFISNVLNDLGSEVEQQCRTALEESLTRPDCRQSVSELGLGDDFCNPSFFFDQNCITPIEPKYENGKKFVGKYSPEARKKRIEKFLEKRQQRVWTKRVKYDVRKNFADSRLRVKGRFVKKEDEELLREFMNLT